MHNGNKLHIVNTIDNGFTGPLSVMLVSLFENNKNCQIKIHLFSAKLNTENIDIIKEIVNRYNQEFEFYSLNPSLFEQFPISERISFAAYYRLIVPNVIDKAVRRYIYLDADTLITGDLRPLFKHNLNNNIIGAINDVVSIQNKQQQTLDIPVKYLYFNSGVLLVDPIAWRENKTTELLQAYLSTNFERCVFHDQDALNAVLYNKREVIAPKWNQQIALFFLDKKYLKLSYNNTYIEAKQYPAIVHFNGHEKPWHYICEHPYRNDFNRYYKLTGYGFFKERITIKKVLKKLKYQIFGWKTIYGRLFNH